MWTRKQLKENAKAVLTKYYWTGFAISLVISLFAGTSGASGSSTLVQVANAFAQEMNENNISPDELIDAINDHPEIIAFLIATIVIVCLIDLFIWVVATALNIFLFNPLKVGKNAYYIRQREDCGKFGNLGIAFMKGKYKGTIKTIFLRDLYLWLWSLLFVIPGIIKSYSYFMVPYIAADNPELPSSRVFEISKQTMKGEKWNLFVLQLSFILWHMGCLITCGLGYLFLTPYLEATYAELYACLKTKAMREGIIAEGELPRSLWNDTSAA
jgi:uncharacterized membrane protein